MVSASIQPLQKTDHSAEHRQLYDQASRLYSNGVSQLKREKLDQALTLALQARALRPAYLPGLNLLARIELQRHNYAAAEFWAEQGLQQKPDSPGLLYSAGHIALGQNQLEDAEQFFTRSAKISRVATKALNSLAHVKLLQRDYVEAFRHYRELIKTQADDIQIRNKLFEAASQVTADFYSEELEQEILRYLDFRNVDFSLLRPLATSLLKHKLRLSEAGCPLEFNALATDELMLKCMKRFYFTDPVFERLLLTLRQSLLISCSRNLAIRHDMLPLTAAMAEQCWLNESVWYTTEQENMLVTQLEILCGKMLQLEQLNSEDFYPALLLIMMYRPLQQCDFFPKLVQRQLDWPDLIHDFMASRIEEAETLKKYADRFARPLNNQHRVSVKVQQQYDQHPYPRWTEIGYNQPADYASSLRQAFPKQSAHLPVAGKPLQTLVAGCGTGRHAIRLAQYFSTLNITAIDLSRTALAYAAMKAEQYHTQNLTFACHDILDLPWRSEQFDIIECSGVLHHMQSPGAGLQALVSTLKNGGLIKIALYSATARRKVGELRSILGEHIPHRESEIRLVREALLQNSIPGEWQEFFESPDFYSMSGCRDLLFHEQEHVFNLPEISELLAGSGLQWLGMLPPLGSHNIIQRTGKHSSDLSLEEWHQIEQENPGLFAGMYQFYAIKKA